MKYLIILSIILNSTLVFGNTEVSYLSKGSPAPYDGYLFTQEKTQSVRTQLLEVDDLKAINLSYQRSVDLYKLNQDSYSKQVDILLSQNTKLTESLQKASGVTIYEKVGYFIAGILATGLAIYGAKQTLYTK